MDYIEFFPLIKTFLSVPKSIMVSRHYTYRA